MTSPLVISLLTLLVLTSHGASSRDLEQDSRESSTLESGTDIRRHFQEWWKSQHDKIDQYKESFEDHSKNFPRSSEERLDKGMVGPRKAERPGGQSPPSGKLPVHVWGPDGHRMSTKWPDKFPFHKWGPAGHRTTKKTMASLAGLGSSTETPLTSAQQEFAGQPSIPEQEPFKPASLSNAPGMSLESGNISPTSEEPEQEPEQEPDQEPAEPRRKGTATDSPPQPTFRSDITRPSVPKQREHYTEPKLTREPEDERPIKGSVDSVTSSIISLSQKLATERVSRLMTDPVFKSLSDAEKLAGLMSLLGNQTLDILLEDETNGFFKHASPSSSVPLPEPVEENINDVILTIATGRQKVPANSNAAVFQMWISDIIFSEFQSNVEHLNETRQEASEALFDFISTANEQEAAKTAGNYSLNTEDLVSIQTKLATSVEKKEEYTAEKDHLRNDVVVRFGIISLFYDNTTDVATALVDVATAIQDPALSTLPPWIQAYHTWNNGSLGNGSPLYLKASGSSGDDDGDGGSSSTVAVVVVLSCMAVVVAVGVVGAVFIRERRRHRLYTKIPSNQAVLFSKNETKLQSDKDRLL